MKSSKKKKDVRERLQKGHTMSWYRSKYNSTRGGEAFCRNGENKSTYVSEQGPWKDMQ